MIEVPQNMLKRFIDASTPNSVKVIETLGLLCGKRGEDGVAIVTNLIIPEQIGHSTGCKTIDLEGNNDYFRIMDNLDLDLDTYTSRKHHIIHAEN